MITCKQDSAVLISEWHLGSRIDFVYSADAGGLAPNDPFADVSFSSTGASIAAEWEEAITCSEERPAEVAVSRERFDVDASVVQKEEVSRWTVPR